MLIPGGGFLTAIMGAFQSVQFLIQRGAQIAGVIMDAFSSVGAIAAGNISGAAGLIERSLAGSIPLALDFVSRLVGIGNLGGKIKAIITRARSKLDSFVDKIVVKVKGLLGKMKTGASNTVTKAKNFISGIFGKKKFTGGKQAHSVWVESKNNHATLMIASTPMEAEQQLKNFAGTAKTQLGADPQGIYSKFIQPRLVYATKEIQEEKRKLQQATSTLPATERLAKMEMGVRSSNITSRVAELTTNLLDEISKHGRNTGTMRPVTLVFPVKSRSGRRYNKHELTLQLAEQENALRRMTVAEWLRRYPFYPGATTARKTTVKRLDATARADYRRIEGQKMIDDLTPKLERQFIAESKTRTVATREARTEAQTRVAAFMRTQAALHMPDKIAGGDYLLDINGMGDGNVNSFIGSQWNSGNKVGTLKIACEAVPAAVRSTVHLNVRLEAR